MGWVYTYVIAKYNSLGYWCLNMCKDLRHLLLHPVSFRNIALNMFKSICIQGLVLLRKRVLLFQRVFFFKKNKIKITQMSKLGSNSLLGSALAPFSRTEMTIRSPFKIWLRSGTGPPRLSNKINWKVWRKMLTTMIHPCKYIWYVIWLALLSGEHKCLIHHRFQNISSTNGVLCLFSCIFGQYPICSHSKPNSPKDCEKLNFSSNCFYPF